MRICARMRIYIYIHKHISALHLHICIYLYRHAVQALVDRHANAVVDESMPEFQNLATIIEQLIHLRLKRIFFFFYLLSFPSFLPSFLSIASILDEIQYMSGA